MPRLLSADPLLCTGCRLCELACSMVKSGEFNPSKSRIQAVILQDEAQYIPLACMQCDEPMCAEVCPTDALRKNRETGLVELDENRCIRCKMCTLACSFGLIHYIPDEQQVAKCDLCGGEPECVAFCQPKALRFVEADSSIAARRRALARRIGSFYGKEGGQ